MHDDDSDETVAPVEFFDGLGEHGLPDNVRRALVLAAFSRFITDPDYFDPDDFSTADNQLAKAAFFHGPFTDFQKVLEESVRLHGLVVSPVCTWTDEEKPHYIVTLSN